MLNKTISKKYSINSNREVNQGIVPISNMRGRTILHPKRRKFIFPIDQIGGASFSNKNTVISPVEQGIQQAKKLSKERHSMNDILNRGIKRKRSASSASEVKRLRRGNTSSKKSTKNPTKKKNTRKITKKPAKKDTKKKKISTKTTKKKKLSTKTIKKSNKKKKKSTVTKKSKKRSKKDIFGFI